MKKTVLLLLFLSLIFSCSKKNQSWVAIGDSITYLNEHTDETGNRITKGYMSRVVEKIPGIRYTNQGHSWTSGNIADSIDQLGLQPADLYTLFLGTNDWWQGRPIGTLSDYTENKGNQTVYGSFRIILNKLRALNKKARIILITPMKRVDFVYIANMKNNAWGSYREKDGQSLEQFADLIKDIAIYEKLEVLDLYNENELSLDKLVNFKRIKDIQTGTYKNYPYPDFIGLAFNPETDEYPYPAEAINITYDGLHPSDKGYEIIADRLTSLIQKKNK
jgi:lysophospholipase L1-like esterase